MRKKIGRDALIVLGIIILWASTSRTAMQFVADHRDNDEWWGMHQMNHGDLASMAHLDYLNKFSASEKKRVRRCTYDGPKNTVLFLHGDSNTWKLQDSVFAGACYYKFIGWSNPCNYHLDTTKRNVLLIAAGERLLREYYGTTQIIDQFRDTGSGKTDIRAFKAPEPPLVRYSSFFPDLKVDNFFNRRINQNLECNLFNYKFMMGLFGCKAAINCYAFGRASGDAVVSDDKQFLFYRETLDLHAPGSSISPVTEEELSKLINNFNTIYDHYRASGFKDIYLSIIPSTVTIMQPQGYNNLIPRIQNDKRLKMTVIDMYSVCKNSKEVLFLKGDTHWNVKGQQKWVDMVNEVLLHPINQTSFK